MGSLDVFSPDKLRRDPAQLQYQVPGKVREGRKGCGATTGVHKAGEVPEVSGADVEVRNQRFRCSAEGSSEEGSRADMVEVKFRKGPAQKVLAQKIPTNFSTDLRRGSSAESRGGMWKVASALIW